MLQAGNRKNLSTVKFRASTTPPSSIMVKDNSRKVDGGALARSGTEIHKLSAPDPAANVLGYTVSQHSHARLDCAFASVGVDKVKWFAI